MTGTKAATPGKRFRPLIILGIIASAIAALILITVLGVYIERRSVAALVARSYLNARGIDSDVSFDLLDFGHVQARVRAGSVDEPDFTAEVMDVTLAYPGSGISGALAPQVVSVRLVRPFLRLTYDGEKLSFGSLQPLIDDALMDESEGPSPEVTIEQGDLLVLSPYGPLRLLANMTLAEGRLSHLDASLREATLTGEGFLVTLSGGTVKADAQGEALNAALTLKLASVSVQGNSAQDIDIASDLRGLTWENADGGATRFAFTGGTLAFTSGAVAGANLAAVRAQANVAFDAAEGTFEGGHLIARGQTRATAELSELRIGDANAPVLAMARFTEAMELPSLVAEFADGRVRLMANGVSRVTVANLRAAKLDLASLNLTSSMPDVAAEFSESEWSLAGAPNLILDGTGLRYALANGTAALPNFRANVSLNGTLRNGDAEGTLQASLEARGSLPPALLREWAQLAGDEALTGAVVTALQNVSLRAPQISAVRKAGETVVTSAAPVTVDGAAGAKIIISPRAGTPLARMREDIKGAFGLDFAGGALPTLRLVLASYRYANANARTAFSADADLETTLDLGVLRGLHVKGQGVLQVAGERVSVTVPGCASVAFESLSVSGTPQFRNGAAQLCGTPAQPLVTTSASGWTFDARLNGATANIEAAGVAAANASGTVRIAGAGAALQSARVDVANMLVSDRAATPRFLPVSGSGAMVLTNQQWQGDIAVTARNRRIASVAVRHAMTTGAGSAVIDASQLNFQPGQFQPTDVLPFTAVFGTRVSGRANFTGTVAWTTDGITTSDGRLQVMGVDLQTKVGNAHRLTTDIVFESLLPVVLAPNRKVTVERIDSFLPVENLNAEFTYTSEAFTLQSVSATVAQGRATLDPLSFLFMPGAETTGVLRLNGLSAEPLIEAGGLKGRVTASAKLNGVVPFSFGPEGVRFHDGVVAAGEPGRLSIKREALTGSVDVGGAGGAPPNAVQDFAYQALENLAFDKLEGRIDSRPMGRLGMVFRLQGRNDPPEALETRVGLVDLLQGRAFDQPLPLPKGTPVDLTLDTSINLDELLASYFGSGAAAPAP